jgi:mono/diheme cytochrome c family protein
MSLVDVASVQEPSLDRVAAGDPDSSYLIRKLEGTAVTGGQMPLFGQPLDQPTIDAMRQWIANGAPPM